MMTFLLVLLFKYGVRICKTENRMQQRHGYTLQDIACFLVPISFVDAVHQYHIWLHGICWLQHIFCAGGHHHATDTCKVPDNP